MKKIIVILAFTCCLFFCCFAQEEDKAAEKKGRWSYNLYGLYDGHVATGAREGLQGQALYRLNEEVDFTLGLEATLPLRFALNVQGDIAIAHWAKGDLTVEPRYLYRQYPELNIQEFTGAFQLGWNGRHWDLQMGLFNRYHAELVQRNNDGMGTIFEPMNVLFGVEYWCHNRQMDNRWDVALRWSNHTDFVIERVSMWFYSVKGYYQMAENVRLIGEIGIHPVGSLNLTSSYDGWYARAGVSNHF